MATNQIFQQLGSHEENNRLLKKAFPSNLSMESNIDNVLFDNSFNIDRRSDMKIVDGFIIPKSIDLDNINNFEIYANGTIIFSIPFSLIIMANKIEIKKDQYFIKFPHELYNINTDIEQCKKYLIIPSISLFYCQISIILTTKLYIPYGSQYKIITKNMYYDNDIRQQLVLQNYDIDIYQYSSFDIKNTSNTINPKSLSTGVYIELTSRLTYFNFICHGIKMHEFTEDLIDFYSFLIYQKIKWTNKHTRILFNEISEYIPLELIYIIYKYIDTNDKFLYFIPFNTLNNDTNGTMNFYGSNNNSITLNVKTENDVYNGKIHIKSLNKLKINSGMGSLAFINL